MKIKKKKMINSFSLFLIFIILLQIVFNRIQWQMYPAYFITIIFIVFTLIRSLFKIEKKNKVIRILVFSLGIICILISSVLVNFFPINDLPASFGPYLVGTKYLNFIDGSRKEILTDDPEDLRKLSVRVWYPADEVSKNKRMTYKENYHQLGTIESEIPPEIIFKHLNILKTNSYLDALISTSQENYPVLVFSPGFLSDYEDYQIYMEELASNGYIVFVPDQPFESKYVVRDEEIFSFSETHRVDYEDHKKVVYPLWKEFWEAQENEKRNNIALLILESDSIMNTNLKIRVQDIQFMIDELEKKNITNIDNTFYSKLDLTRLGIFGHSMGGAVTGQTCLVDERFKAGINLDGFQWGDVHTGTIDQPYMTIYSEPFKNANAFIDSNFSNNSYSMIIQGSSHANFGDTGFLMPITKQFGMMGEIPEERMRMISNKLIVSFFDEYVKKSESVDFEEILESKEYPEISRGRTISFVN